MLRWTSLWWWMGVFSTHENLHVEVFAVQEVVAYRNDLLPYLVSFCCTCTVAVVVLLHFSKYTYCQLWEYSDVLFSYSNMSSLVQPLSVFTQCLDDITAGVCSRQKVTAGSWDKTKHSSGPVTDQSVCETSFYSSKMSHKPQSVSPAVCKLRTDSND